MVILDIEMNLFNPLWLLIQSDDGKQAEKLKSREMKEGWIKNAEGWWWMIKNDEIWWRMIKNEEWWRMNDEGFTLRLQIIRMYV